MRTFYKIICYVTGLMGFYALIRFFIARKRVTIVLYHDPAPSTFSAHMSFLQSRYNIISLDLFVRSLSDPSIELPEYALVITFDDGHRRNFELLETLKKNNIPVTIYLCSGIVNTSRKFWFRLEGVSSKKLKKMSHRSRLEWLRTNHQFMPEAEFPATQRQALDLAEINEMKAIVNFQSHTKFHPLLTTCQELEARGEITHSKDELEKLLQNPVKHFAYPNGDYTSREIRMLQKAGYVSARSTDIGWNDRNTNPYRLKITGVSDTASVLMLKGELTGIPGFIYNLYTGGVTGKSLRGMHVPEFENA